MDKNDDETLNNIIARLHSHPNVDKDEYDKYYFWLETIKKRL